jgi:hypothetical protein
MKFFAILILFSLVAATQAWPAQLQASALEQMLTAKSKALADALKKKDVEFLKRTLADDFNEVWSDGHLYSKYELFGAAQSGAVQEFRPYNMKMLPVSESAAIVTYDCIVAVPEGDEDMGPRYQHISDLWVQQGGEWKLKFQQATPLRAID